MKTSRAILLGLVIGILVMTLMPVSAAQDNSSSTEDLVRPVVIHIGGLNDCDDPSLGTSATQSLRIVSPADGTFTDPVTGVQFRLSGIDGNRTFNWSILTSGWVAYDITVKGGTNTNHYDYQASSAGLQTSDKGLHAPPKGNRFDNLSHITFCYDTPPLTISGTKFHDRDSDGDPDPLEGTLEGFTINAYDSDGLVATTTTDDNGEYELVVGSGTFTVCEVVLDPVGPFEWHQTWPDDNADCEDISETLAPAGYDVTVGTVNVVDKDFRNVRGVRIGCGEMVSLPAEDNVPSSTVSLSSENCESTEPQFMIFDAGYDPAETNIDQFVVFGGIPTGTATFTQTIVWEPEDANYDGAGNLIVPPTLVALAPGGTPTTPGAICDANQPNAAHPDCRASRVISEDGSTAGGESPTVRDIQVTEVWKFLGDPTRAR